MPGDGEAYRPIDFGAYQDINEIKDHYAGAVAPTDPEKGLIWYDSGAAIYKQYNGSAWQALAGDPIGAAPVGSIIAVVMGYFTDGSNGGYTRVLGASNDATGVNGYYNAKGWYVCDGAAVNAALSPVWVGANRYVPKLTDDRFIMGDTAAGSVGGSNTMTHTHPLDPPEVETGACSSTINAQAGAPPLWVATSTHTHNINIAEFNSGAASNAENRPAYLACIYIVRVF